MHKIFVYIDHSGMEVNVLVLSWDTVSSTTWATRLSPAGRSHLLLETQVLNGNPATERNVPSTHSCSRAVRARRTSYIDHEDRKNCEQHLLNKD